MPKTIHVAHCWNQSDFFTLWYRRSRERPWEAT